MTFCCTLYNNVLHLYTFKLNYELIMKTEAIIVRVDKKMKSEISKLATENRRELSDYLRLVIEEAIKNKTKI